MQHDGLRARYAEFLCPDNPSSSYSTSCRVERLGWGVGDVQVPDVSTDVPIVFNATDGVPGLSAGRFVAEVYADGRNRLSVARERDLGALSVIENYLRTATARALLDVGGIMLHSGGFVYQGLAYVFVGESGAGKTTLTHIAHAAGARILSDDINVLLPVPGGFEVLPVPFAGDFGVADRVAGSDAVPAPLGGLFCLRKSEGAAIEDIAPSRQLAKLIAAAPFVNQHASTIETVMRVAQSMLGAIPVRHLSFRREEEFGVIANLISREHSHAA